MSIVDAIEKAKQLAQQRAGDNPVKARRTASGEPRVRRSDAPARERVNALPAAEPPGLSIALPLVPFDLEVCSANRIIVPGIDPQLMQLASSPYRMLRTRILQRCRNNGWSVLGITSPGPSEGKSVTALNLAINIAREGNSDVFLIDADMRNPSVCRYLGVSPSHELVDFFHGKAAAQDVFFNTGIDRLALAGNNIPTANASELLASGKLDELVAHIRSFASKPLILLDLPPVVNTDDALVVAPRVDAMVLVVSEGVTRRDGVATALNLLSEYTVAGVVLNQSLESLGSDYYGAQ
jgi:protein-tyrosine kinase